jgi:putative tryptophan/tyrosine transport system substrate-binding protein
MKRRANLFPSPLWGWVRGGGPTGLRRRILLRDPTPLPTLPHTEVGCFRLRSSENDRTREHPGSIGRGKRLRRRSFLALIGGAALAPLAAQAQPATTVRRIALLMNEDSPEVQSWLKAFREELSKLGWQDGRDLILEYRWAGNNREVMQQDAKEIVASHPDLILSSSSPVVAILLAETRTIPLVFPNIIDPVGQGFVASLSHPGGNATGLVNLEPSMAGKWVELLKEVVPRVARVVVPVNPATAPYADLYLDYFRSSAQKLGVEIIPAQVVDIAALEKVVTAEARQPNTGFIPIPSAFMVGHEIAAPFIRSRVPAVSFNPQFARDGGLLSYGNNINDNWRRSALFVDRILKGEKPADLPIEVPVKFELVVNLKTAKELGLSIPQDLLATADEVIE